MSSGGASAVPCLNVMGLIPGTGKGAFQREHRALHRALLVWTQRNYLRMHRESPKVAEACLIGSISFDANRNILVKTYAQGLSREPAREYLSLVEPPRSVQK